MKCEVCFEETEVLYDFYNRKMCKECYNDFGVAEDIYDLRMIAERRGKEFILEEINQEIKF